MQMESMIIATKSQNRKRDKFKIYLYICNAVGCTYYIMHKYAMCALCIDPKYSIRVAVANRPTAAAEYF